MLRRSDPWKELRDDPPDAPPRGKVPDIRDEEPGDLPETGAPPQAETAGGGDTGGGAVRKLPKWARDCKGPII